jgi:hypothetical protein
MKAETKGRRQQSLCVEVQSHFARINDSKLQAIYLDCIKFLFSGKHIGERPALAG